MRPERRFKPGMDVGDGLAAEGDFQGLGAEARTICKRRK
jgi:hypothetical protein